MANLVNNQTGRPHQTAEAGVGLAGASCSRKPVSQLRGLMPKKAIILTPDHVRSLGKGLLELWSAIASKAGQKGKEVLLGSMQNGMVECPPGTRQ